MYSTEIVDIAPFISSQRYRKDLMEYYLVLEAVTHTDEFAWATLEVLLDRCKTLSSPEKEAFFVAETLRVFA